MRHLYLLLFLFTSVTAFSQNPLIIKTVGGTALEPSSDAQLNLRVKPWKGKIFYPGKGSETQCLLVMTDGTTAGTVMLKDLGDIGNINGVFPAKDFVYLTTLKSTIVSFSPVTVQWRRQLWRTDGTANGTTLIKAFDPTNSTLNTGIFYSDALSSVNYSIDGNLMYFNGFDAANGPELWRTDGTETGTNMIKDIFPGTAGSNPFGFCKVGGTTCFLAREASGFSQLWQTDGTPGGTQVLTRINATTNSIAEFFCGLYKGKMYFWANDGITGAEVWYTDGTAGGTQMLKEIVPGNNAFTGTGGIRTDLNFIQDGKYLYFPSERSKHMWRTDGTADGTIQLTSTPMASANIAGAIAKEGAVYWLEYGSPTYKLYKTNGTVAGTAMVANNLVSAVQLYSYRGAGWFAARAANQSDVEPWRSDGTAANTARALDIHPGGFSTFLNSSSPFGYTELNGYLYFFATNGGGMQLFRYNGDMRFNPIVTGNNWRDSANWNSLMPPGITDTAFISAAAMPNVAGQNAYAGTLITEGAATINLASATDSLFISGSVVGSSVITFTGNGALALKNTAGDTVRLDATVSVQNLLVQTAAALNNQPLTVNNNLTLHQAGKLVLNSGNLILSGSSSSITASAANYVATNGSGSLQVQNIGPGQRTGSVVFPVGTTENYNPVSLANSGAADHFSVRVHPGVATAYSGENPSGTPFTNNAVGATWMINEATAGGSNATVSLQWNGVQELPGFNRTISQFAHYYNGSWQLSPAAAATGSDPYAITGTGITSFSPFGVLNNNATLPVHRVLLKVKKESSANQCSWTITGEGTSVALQRSFDGTIFKTIHTGPFSATGSYTDHAAGIGKAWYRLQTEDGYGAKKLSNVVSVSPRMDGRFSVYPTVFRQSFSVQNNAGQPAVLKIFGADARLQVQKILAEGLNTIAAEGWAPQPYFYQIMVAGKVVASGQVLKQ